MKCPRCGSRFFKSNADSTSFFFKRLIVKSDQLTVVCSQCGEGTKPNTDMMEALKNALLVRVTPGSI